MIRLIKLYVCHIWYNISLKHLNLEMFCNRYFKLIIIVSILILFYCKGLQRQKIVLN